MTGAGIFHGDLIIVDRSLTPQHGSVVVASVNGETTLKRFVRERKKVLLVAENPNYAPLCVTDETELQIWGVVTSNIHRHKP